MLLPCKRDGGPTKSVRDDKSHRASFSGVKIRAVPKFAAVTNDAAAQIPKSIEVASGNIHLLTNANGTYVAEGFSLAMRGGHDERAKDTRINRR